MSWQEVFLPSPNDLTLLTVSQFHPSSYSAFCRNYGTHTTKAVGSLCWNEKAIKSMTSDMSGLWDAFDRDVESYLDRIYQSVEEVFRNVLSATSDAGKSTVVFSYRWSW